MTLIYVGLIANFVLLIGSWVFFFKFFKQTGIEVSESFELEIENIKEDLILVTKNPAAARRKLKTEL